VKTPTFIKKSLELARSPKFALSVTAMAAGSAAIEGLALSQNLTYPLPAHACVSPMAVSESYVDPATSTLFQTQTGLFTSGVRMTGVLPSDAYGVQVSFESPGAGQKAWNEHASKMVKANDAGNYAAKMAIGDGEVAFGVRVVAAQGSPLCDVPPHVTFTHESVTEYFLTSGTVPYEGYIDDGVNLF
jgi:hypothetical protein